jgi:hypothetical protein
LTFIRDYVTADEKTCGADSLTGRTKHLPVPPNKPVFYAHGEVEFSRRQNVPADRTRRRSADPRNFSFQDGIGIFFIANPKSAVLLKLLDHGASHEHLDPGNESLVFESRHGDRVDVLQVIWFDWSNVVAEATAEAETDGNRREEIFHGAGDAVASGEADASGAAEASDVGPAAGADADAGAVVVSGISEAGGGSETSVSGGGNGAASSDDPRVPGSPLAVSCPLVFFFAAAASDAAKAGCRAASPSFFRNWSILFLALSLSVEPGCWRITSL